VEDCFFFIDYSVPETEQKMSVLCIDCQSIFKIEAWLYRGTENGYGPFDYKCCKCDKLIHSKEEEGEI
jgi:hypothetical protein